MQRVDQQFFPASDRNELIVDFQLPRSSSIFASETAIKGIEDFITASGDAQFFTSYIGRNVIRFYLPLSIQPPSDHHSQIVIMAKDLEARDRLETSLEAFLSETYPRRSAGSARWSLGPPIGWPVQYRVTGPDVEVLRGKALELAGIVASHPTRAGFISTGSSPPASCASRSIRIAPAGWA